MEPIRLWRTTEGDWRKTNGGAFNVTEYAALTRADFDALAAEAADARTIRAERDSLVKERDEGRTEIELMAMAGEMMNRQLAAATARADKAEALLRDVAAELREDGYVVIPDRIDALLEGKA